jgi:hypothetical protein
MNTIRFFSSNVTRCLAFVLFALVLGFIPNTSANAATNGIVNGPNAIGAEDSFSTTYGQGKNVKISIVNDVLTIKTDSYETQLKYNNYIEYVDEAVVNSEDRLVHILLLGGMKQANGNYSNGKTYVVFDLDTSNVMLVYRNLENGKYCSSRNKNAYLVGGYSSINDKYFYEKIDGQSSRQRWLTRAEYDIIAAGGDPSIENSTTQAPATTQASATTQAPATTEVAPNTDNTIKIHTEFDIDFWWQRYIKGEITWEQLEDILWKYNWTAQETSKETSTTYYFYDSTGKLIKEVTETTGNKNQAGTGVGQATAAASGSATVKIAENGSGNANGVVNTTIDNSTTTIINGASGNAVIQDSKIFWETTRQGNKVKLWKTVVKTVNGKIESYRNNVSTAIFKEKKGIVKWNGKTYKKIKKCQFIEKSHRLLIVDKNGKAYSLPNKSGDSARKYLGKNVKTYKCVSDTYNKGLVTALVKKGKSAKLVNVIGK